MAVTNRPEMSASSLPSSSSGQAGGRRIWHTPTSKAAYYWAIFASFYCAVFYLLYLFVFDAPVFTGPWFDPLRCGVMSYIMILVVAAYSLRARFIHSLPGKAQNWVWMHIWLGIASVLLALLHADFRFVLHFECMSNPRFGSVGYGCGFTDHYWGMPALYLLIFIGVSGIVGKLLDRQQTCIIANEASTNGVGIAKAIPEELLELEYQIERYNAGKSDPFKQYCTQALQSVGILPPVTVVIVPQEQNDFRNAYECLVQHARLQASLQKLQRARKIFKIWRTVHMALVPLTLIIITYHAVAELLVNVLKIVKP